MEAMIGGFADMTLVRHVRSREGGVEGRPATGDVNGGVTRFSGGEALRLGSRNEAEDQMAAHAGHRVASRIVAVNHGVGRHRDPDSIEQHLISPLGQTALHASTIRRRATGSGPIRPLQAVEPRRKRRVGIRGRRAHGRRGAHQDCEQGEDPGSPLSRHDCVAGLACIAELIALTTSPKGPAGGLGPLRASIRSLARR